MFGGHGLDADFPQFSALPYRHLQGRWRKRKRGELREQGASGPRGPPGGARAGAAQRLRTVAVTLRVSRSRLADRFAPDLDGYRHARDLGPERDTCNGDQR